MADDFLIHYGVKGMHWGVRKRSGSTPSGRTPHSQPKKARDLSDEQLKKRITRLEMEKKYNDLQKARSGKSNVEVPRNKKRSDLSNAELEALNKRQKLEAEYRKQNPNGFARGQALVSGLMGTAGLAVSIYNLAKSPAGKAAIKKGKEAVYKYNYLSGKTLAITSG